MLRVIGAADIRRLLPMRECIDVMERAMRAASSGELLVPLRTIMPLVDDSAHFALMPGSAIEPPVYGAKIVSLHDANAARGLPVIQGFVCLFDHASGTPLAILEGATITAIRTAAASGLATRLLARPDARSHGVLGTGVQASTHIDAVACARSLDTVVIWGRDHGKAQALADEQADRTGLTIRATRDAAEAAACDIVSTVTASREPILFGDWVRPGSHVNLVGSHSPDSREADSELIARAQIYTDALDSLLTEGGDIVIPVREGRIDTKDIRGEIGDVLLGRLRGRGGDAEITLYKSHGIVAQDLLAAHHVYARAQQQGAGTTVDFQA